jgi:UDP-2-acetamido-2-deoxy-ribo-hexuluronate aminotransferase
MMKVPFIDLKRVEPDFRELMMAKFASMLANAQFIGGAEVAELESRLQSHVSVRHAVSCANGTDALQLALRALGVGRGDVVLVPNVTFWATFEAVVNVGANPVTVDVSLDDGGVAYEALELALAQVKPKAVIIVHLYGWGSRRLAEIRELCRQNGVLLIEDGAQCYGATYQGQSIYKGALISTTSFYPAKVLGGAGDGGAVFTDNSGLADNVRRLGNHGRTAHYGYGDVGWNSRLDSLQAAFLTLSMNYIDQRIASRREAARTYQEVLPKLGVEVMVSPVEYVENGYCNVCLVRDPEKKMALESALKKADIGFGNIYPGVMATQDGARSYNKGHYGGNDGEVLCASVLNLPLFPYMTPSELGCVIEVVEGVLTK